MQIPIREAIVIVERFTPEPRQFDGLVADHTSPLHPLAVSKRN